MLYLLVSTLLILNTSLLYHLEKAELSPRSSARPSGKNIKPIKFSVHGSISTLSHDEYSDSEWMYQSELGPDGAVLTSCAGTTLSESSEKATAIARNLTQSYLAWRGRKESHLPVSTSGTHPHSLKHFASLLFAGASRDATEEFDWRWLPDAVHYQEAVSCVLSDAKYDVLWAVSDLAGANPLWYAATDANPDLLSERTVDNPHDAVWRADVHITTDLAGMQRMLGSQSVRAVFTPLGPAQLLCLHLGTGSILSSYAWPAAPPHLIGDKANSEAEKSRIYSRQLMSSLFSELLTLIPNQTEPVLVDSDALSPEALLLECAVGAMRADHNNSGRAFTRSAPTLLSNAGVPRRGDEHWGIFTDLVANLTTYGGTDINYPTGGSHWEDNTNIQGTVYPAAELDSERMAWKESEHTSPWKPVVLRVAASSWQQCYAAARAGATLLIPHSGIPNPTDVPSADHLIAPLRNYYANLFCTRLGVRVLFPMASLRAQKIFAGSNIASARLYQALRTLQSEGVCPGLPVENGKSVFTMPPASEKNTNAILQAVAGSPQGRLYELYNAANMHSETQDGKLFIVLATSGYHSMLNNFLCSVSRVISPLNPGNRLPVLVVSFHQSVADLAEIAGAGAFSIRDGDIWTLKSVKEIDEAVKEEETFGSRAYQNLMLYRTALVWELLAMGYSPVVADIDTVWMRNPLPILRATEDKARADVTVALDGMAHQREICGCFIALHAGPQGNALALWTEVFRRHKMLLSNWKLAENATFDLDSEQKIVSELLSTTARGFSDSSRNDGKPYVDSLGRLNRDMQSRTPAEHGGEFSTNFSLITGRALKLAVLPQEMFPSGHDYYNGGTSFNDANEKADSGNRCGFTPAIVHNNFIMGRAAKESRFRRYGQWFLRSDANASNAHTGERELNWMDMHCTFARQHATGFTRAEYNQLATLHQYTPAHQSFVDINHKNGLATVSFTNLVASKGFPSIYTACDDDQVNNFASTQNKAATLHLGSSGRFQTYAKTNTFDLFRFEFELDSESRTGLHGNSSLANHGVEEKAHHLDFDRHNEQYISVVLDSNHDVASDVDVYVRDRCVATDTCALSPSDHERLAAKRDARVWNLRYQHAHKWDANWTWAATFTYPANESDSSSSPGGDYSSDNDNASINGAKRSKSCNGETSASLTCPTTIPLKFKIIVLAYDRSESLKRLLQSLLLADYSAATDRGQSVDLEIIIDGPRYADRKRKLQNLQAHSGDSNSSDSFNAQKNQLDPTELKIATEEAKKLSRTNVIASLFRWPYGNVKHTSRPRNIGLANMWLQAWQPTNAEDGERELAIVLEDDNEVSALYFQWLHRAVRAYYDGEDGEDNEVTDSKNAKYSNNKLSQIQLQRNLLESVNHDIEADLERNDNRSTHSHLSAFVETHAGLSYPLLYGICLQHQHVDGARYPRDLKIRNGFLPFLYEVVGSWGPLLFPLPWLAFQRWVEHLHRLGAQPPAPITKERTIINKFYLENRSRYNSTHKSRGRARSLPLRSIWTPWMSLFASTTHSMCLYSNFPGNLSLIANHREAGENHLNKLGPSSALLQEIHFSGEGPAYFRRLSEYKTLFASKPIGLPDALVTYSAVLSARDATLRAVHAIYSAFTYFPPLERVAEWQYGLLVDRIGAAGAEANHYYKLIRSRATETSGALDALLGTCISRTAHALDAPICGGILSDFGAHKLAHNSASLLQPDEARSTHTFLDAFTIDHWSAVRDMVEAHVLPHCTVVHIGSSLSPMFFLLLSRYWYHDLYILPSVNLGDADVHRNSQCDFVANATAAVHKSRISCTSQFSNGALQRGLAVVSQSQLSTYSEKYEGGESQVWENVPTVEWLLVLGPCFGAPSSLFAAQLPDPPPEGETEAASHGYKLVRRFSVVEDVCREGLPTDFGAVLYRASSWEYLSKEETSEAPGVIHIKPEWAVSRRLRGGLVARRVFKIEEFP